MAAPSICPFELLLPGDIVSPWHILLCLLRLYVTLSIHALICPSVCLSHNILTLICHAQCTYIQTESLGAASTGQEYTSGPGVRRLTQTCFNKPCPHPHWTKPCPHPHWTNLSYVNTQQLSDQVLSVHSDYNRIPRADSTDTAASCQQHWCFTTTAKTSQFSRTQYITTIFMPASPTACVYVCVSRDNMLVWGQNYRSTSRSVDNLNVGIQLAGYE